LLGQKLLEGKTEFAEAFNFGPSEEDAINVAGMITLSKNTWGNIEFEIDNTTEHPHEANYLKLDCSKANHKLQWKSLWNVPITVEKTINWYKEYYNNNILFSNIQIDEYLQEAFSQNVAWINK